MCCRILLATYPQLLILSYHTTLLLASRVGVAALVCTRWRQLAQSPQLMRSVEVCRRGCPAVPLSAAAFSFGEWYYEWAGPHAQRLHVELPVDFGPYEADDEEIGYALDRLDNMLYTSVDDYGCHLQELRLMQQMPTDIDWVRCQRLLRWTLCGASSSRYPAGVPAVSTCFPHTGLFPVLRVRPILLTRTAANLACTSLAPRLAYLPRP